MPKKILVIANEAATSDELQAAVAGPADGLTEVLVVAPTLDSDGSGWSSDADAAAQAAFARLRVCIQRLEARGLYAIGTIGDGDPIRATLNALHVYPADEIVIPAHGEQRWNGLGERLVERVAEHFDGPILEVPVGRERQLMAA